MMQKKRVQGLSEKALAVLPATPARQAIHSCWNRALMDCSAIHVLNYVSSDSATVCALRPSSDRVREKKSIEIRERRRLSGAATCVLVGPDLRGILRHPCHSGTDLNAIPEGSSFHGCSVRYPRFLLHGAPNRLLVRGGFLHRYNRKGYHVTFGVSRAVFRIGLTPLFTMSSFRGFLLQDSRPPGIQFLPDRQNHRKRAELGA